LAEKYQTAPPPRGEIVILVEGASAFHHAVSDDAIIALLQTPSKPIQFGMRYSKSKRSQGQKNVIFISLL